MLGAELKAHDQTSLLLIETPSREDTVLTTSLETHKISGSSLSLIEGGELAIVAMTEHNDQVGRHLQCVNDMAAMRPKIQPQITKLPSLRTETCLSILQLDGNLDTFHEEEISETY
jgi:hypothetical protein